MQITTQTGFQLHQSTVWGPGESRAVLPLSLLAAPLVQRKCHPFVGSVYLRVTLAESTRSNSHAFPVSLSLHCMFVHGEDHLQASSPLPAF